VFRLCSRARALMPQSWHALSAGDGPDCRATSTDRGSDRSAN
jgi:hypothetical protein